MSNIKPKYPYLGKHKDGNIVLFTSKDCGVVVVSTESGWSYIGFYSSEWREWTFNKVEGSVGCILT